LVLYMKNIFFLLLTSVMFLSTCKKDDSDISNYCFDVPEIGGYIQRDANGSTIGIVGKPIHYPGEYPGAWMMVCPNPLFSYMNSFVVYCSDNTNEKKLWITRAKFKNQLSPTGVTLGMNTAWLSGGKIFEKKFVERDIHIDKSLFTEGYYRVYLEIDGQVYYDNLVISNETIYY